MKKSESFSIGLIIGLIIVFIGVGPLLTIWSLNTLFGLAIEYTWSTWAASFILDAVVGGNIIRSSSK
jgi:hypothetical protein